ncbi:hypothetical protein RclHR1_03220008 [Rhizophagus clarus]|uniref:Uncharacterized protein n=1 Tax=Rhizophagus clarus TaxID=94130 RepID=A0A2Z6R895_9GLOM|nr:hypothetical protein RclHR1_03220008 [Rhizophagus clarus]
MSYIAELKRLTLLESGITRDEVSKLLFYAIKYDKDDDIKEFLERDITDNAKIKYLRTLLASGMFDFILHNVNNAALILCFFSLYCSRVNIARKTFALIFTSRASGVGKTRIGFEIEKFIIKDERIQKGMDQLKTTFKHIFINIKEIMGLLGEEQKRDSDTNCYPRNREDFVKAENILTMLIAIYFFAKVWTSEGIEKCKESIPKILDYGEVIKLIRKEMKLDEDALLILILQIDDFQISPYWTITLLHVISTIVKYKNTLVIAVCTGTEPSQIENLGRPIHCITQYNIMDIHLPPMNFQESLE